MKRDLFSGLLLIVASTVALGMMALHPTGHEVAASGRNASASVFVHAVMLLAIAAVFAGLVGLKRRLGGSSLATTALTFFGFGSVAGMSAAIASGFVATSLVRQMAAAELGRKELLDGLVTMAGLLNQAYAAVAVVAWALGIVLWGVAMIRHAGGTKLAGIAGIVVGSAILIVFLSGEVRLDVHGFGAILLAQSAWVIWVGALLCREEPAGPNPA